MDEFLSTLARHTNLPNLRIRQYPEVIFFCGGPTAKPHEAPLSARDFFLRHIEQNAPALFERIFLAEQANAWAADMIKERYTPDLLTFESHISGMASAVSLIVESPGSIAELGSFCLLPSVRQRLMVVARNGWIKEDSFISLGPFAYLRENSTEGQNPIYVYPWELRRDINTGQMVPEVKDLALHADHFIEALQAFEHRLPKTSKLDVQNMGHLSLLICDLIYLFSALRITEIIQFLSNIGIEDINRLEVKKHIFMLQKLNLVTTVPYGSSEYYVSRSETFFVDLNLDQPPTDLKDRARFMFVVREHIQGRDRGRSRAIALAHDSGDGALT